MKNKLLLLLSALKFRTRVSDVVILHGHDLWVRKSIGRGISFQTLGVAPEDLTFFLNFRILYKFIIFSFTINLEDWFSGSEFRQFTKRLYILYTLSVIDTISPKVVVTYIDNSSIFQCLSNIDKKRRYVAVQNSVRNEYNAHYVLEKNNINRGIISHDIFFCYGPSVRKLYQNRNHLVKEYLFVI